MQIISISTLLEHYGPDTISGFKYLSDIGRLPPGDGAHDEELSKTPPLWSCEVKFEVEGPSGLFVPVTGRGSAASKKSARKSALRMALEMIGREVSNEISAIGKTAHERRTITQHAQKHQPQTPTLHPTLAQQKVIERAVIDYSALKELCQHLTLGNQAHLVVFDVEKAENGPELLEIGWVEMEMGASEVSVTHCIVEEHINISNTYVACNRYGFAHGNSKTVPQAIALELLSGALDRLRASPFGVLVGHSLRTTDMPWTQTKGVTFEGLRVIDVDALEKTIRKTYQSTSLERMAIDIYNVPFLGPAHNAGNDAVATTRVFLQQAGTLCGLESAEIDRALCSSGRLDEGTVILHSSYEKADLEYDSSSTSQKTLASYRSAYSSISSAPSACSGGEQDVREEGKENYVLDGGA